MNAPTSLAMTLASASVAEREVFLMSLTREELNALYWEWSFWARPEQIEPSGDWSTWLILAGRGFGKTRTGSEWVRSMMIGTTPLSAGKVRRLALVAETAADARDVLAEGPSGILATSPPDLRPRYEPSKRRLTWPNGAIATLYSAEDPEQLRGPEHDAAWCDELAKWRYVQETWDMLQFGLRTGDNPRVLVTTTPRPIPIIRELLADPTTHATRGSTYDNAANLAPKFLRKMKEKYEGTRLGRQELRAEVLDDVPGALWTRAMFDRRSPTNPNGTMMGPEERLPELARIVVAIDPSGSSGEEEDSGDDIGIVVAALGVDGVGYVLEDATCNLSPAGWGRRAVERYEFWGADKIVAERNYGGAMVQHVVRSANRRVNYGDVVATRGKVVRAEPVSALYEQGKIRHHGGFGRLEDELLHFTTTGYLGRGSPNRADALVWAITELFFGRSGRGSSATVGGHH